MAENLLNYEKPEKEVWVSQTASHPVEYVPATHIDHRTQALL